MIFKTALLFLFFSTNLYISALEEKESRIYIIKIISFHTVYELYCTTEVNGYYKYPQKFEDKTIYLTYESNDFFNQSKFDENFTIVPTLLPSTMWSSNNGSVFRLKKRYSPVIEKNRERKNYPYGFGKN